MSRTCSRTKACAESGFALVVTVRLIPRTRWLNNSRSSRCDNPLSTSRVQRPCACYEVFVELHVHLFVTFFDRVLQGHFHIDLILKLKRCVAPNALINFLKLRPLTISISSLSRSLHFGLLDSITSVGCVIWSEAHTATRLSLKIPKRGICTRSMRWLTSLWAPELSWIS